MVSRLLTAMERIDADLAVQSLQILLDRPDLYPMDRVLVPAALSLQRTEAIRAQPSIAGLCRAVLPPLKARIDEPLEPTADWRRLAEVACQCTACRELVRFLNTRDQQVWQYKANEASRKHVADSVSRHGYDLRKRGQSPLYQILLWPAPP